MGLAIQNLGPDAAARWGTAKSWFEAAAAGGSAEAIFSLAKIAAEAGDGETAKRLYRQAARAGVPAAQFNLALLLLDSATEADAIDALAWLTLAAEAEQPNAAAARDAVSAALSNTARATARIKAEAWRSKPQP